MCRTLGVLVLLSTLALPAIAAGPQEAKKLRDSVHAALRREATSSAGDRELALRELVDIYRALETDTLLTEKERRELKSVLRGRLVRSSEALAKSVKLPAAVRGVLLQQGPAAQGAQGARANANLTPAQQSARDLITLIEQTISPASWATNGGLGTIFYFAPAQALVVAQTEEVHDALGGMLGGMR